MEPCSLACFGSAMATIPTLQCRLCLCMYHPACVGLAPLSDRVLLSYVCKVSVTRRTVYTNFVDGRKMWFLLF